MNAITISNGLYQALIRADMGGNCLQLLHLPTGASLLRTPPDEDTYQTNSPNVFGMPFLFHPNRISDGKYTFEGRDYVFPINEPARHNAIHGVMSVTPFTVETQEKDHVVLAYAATEKAPYMAFPHAFHLTLEYKVTDAGMRQTLTVTNDSSADMPFGIGFHTSLNAAFMPGSKAEDSFLAITAGKQWEYTPDRILPTGVSTDPGEYTAGVCAAHQRVSGLFDMGRQAGGGTAVLENRKQHAKIVYEVSEGYHFWMLYNMDGEHDFICPEPQTWMIDAPNVNLPDEITGFSALRPGESRTLSTVMHLEA